MLLVQCAFAQKLPSTIRGYNLYETKVTVVNADDSDAIKKGADAAVRLFEPQITGMGLSGVTVEVVSEVTSLSRSGRVDLMTFRDFQINGIAIQIEEYASPFPFKKGETVRFQKPARITINAANIAKGAYKELIDPKNDWIVTGTILVFGKFKKFGFGFKRVVPIKIDLKVKNLFR